MRDRFDLAVLPRTDDPWSGALVAAAGVPLRAGYARRETLPFLTHAFAEHGSRHVARESVVLALRAAALLRRRPRAASPLRQPLLLLEQGDHDAVSRVLTEAGIAASAPIVVHPTSGWRLKTWPIERWARVASRLGEHLQAPVLIAGERRDRALLEEIVDRAGDGPRAVDGLSIAALAALHARARLVVGIDSGALHLAALVGAPVIGLFGPFGPGRFAPIGPPDRVGAVWRRLPCSPCGSLDAPPCGATQEPACLTAISAEDVVDAALGLALDLRRPRSS
jgi:ADP-heptose:LPS heptosyltransferase